MPPALGAAVVAALDIGLLHRLEPGAETLEVGIDRLAVGADRALERRGGNRQPPAAGDDPEHDRVDHGAGLLGERVHVEQEMRPANASSTALISRALS